MKKIRKVTSIEQENIGKYKQETLKYISKLNEQKHEKSEGFKYEFDLACKACAGKNESQQEEVISEEKTTDICEIKNVMEGRNLGRIYKLVTQLRGNTVEEGMKCVKKTKNENMQGEVRAEDNEQR